MECCSRVAVKKVRLVRVLETPEFDSVLPIQNNVKMLGSKSEELANLLNEASQSRLWTELLEKLLQESAL